MRLERVYRVLVLAAVLTLGSGYDGYVIPLLVPVMIIDLVLRRFQWVRTTFDRPLAALLAIVIASGLVSEWRGQSTILALSFALVMLVGVYSTAVVLRSRPQAFREIVWLWIAGALFAAVWGFLRWYPSSPEGADTPALGRTAMGTVLAATAMIVLGASTVADRRGIRVALAGALVVLLIVLEATWSRGAWIGALVGAAVMIALAPRRRTMLVAMSLASIVIATSVVGTLSGAWLFRRAQSIPSFEANADRLALWRTVPKIVRDRPILGTGYGTFAFAWPRYRDDPQLGDKPTAHNVYLNFAAETGLAGLAAFLVFVAAALRGLWSHVVGSRGDRSSDGLWVGLFAAAVAILVHQLFDGTILSWHTGYAVIVLFTLGGVKSST